MRIIRLLSMAAMVAAAPLAAQDAPPSEWPVAAGSRVRIRSPLLGADDAFRGARYAIGSVVSATADTLIFRADGDSMVTAIIPTGRIFKIEIARGTHDSQNKGALLGSLAGFVAGATIAGLTRRSCGDTGCPEGYYRDADPIIGGLLGALGGALIGAWLGRRPTDNWVPVVIPGR